MECRYLKYCRRTNLTISCREVRANCDNYAHPIRDLTSFLEANHKGKNMKQKAYYQSHTKTCQNCGKSFLASNTHARFCSRQCYEEYKGFTSMRGEKVCGVCGKTFIPLNNGQKFCCKECAINAQRTPPKQLVCQNCGKTYFEKFKSKIKTTKFCSKECYAEYRAKQVEIRKNAMREKSKNLERLLTGQCDVLNAEQIKTQKKLDIDMLTNKVIKALIAKGQLN